MELFKEIFSYIWLGLVFGGAIFAFIEFFNKIFSPSGRDSKDDYNQDDV